MGLDSNLSTSCQNTNYKGTWTALFGFSLALNLSPSLSLTHSSSLSLSLSSSLPLSHSLSLLLQTLDFFLYFFIKRHQRHLSDVFCCRVLVSKKFGALEKFFFKILTKKKKKSSFSKLTFSKKVGNVAGDEQRPFDVDVRQSGWVESHPILSD